MLFDRPRAGSRAVLLNLRLDSSNANTRLAAEELTELVRSSEVEPVAFVHARRSRPHSRWFIGSGKVDEVAATLDAARVVSEARASAKAVAGRIGLS